MSDTAAGGAGEAELRQALEPFVSRHPDWPEDNRIAVQILSAAITELVALRAVAVEQGAVLVALERYGAALRMVKPPYQPGGIAALTEAHEVLDRLALALDAARTAGRGEHALVLRGRGVSRDPPGRLAATARNTALGGDGVETMIHARMIAGALAAAEASEGRPLTQEQRAGLLALIEQEVVTDPLWLPDDLGQGLLAAVRADDGRTGIGFYATSPEGHAMHVNGARDMPQETLQAIGELADLAYKQVARQRGWDAE